MTQPIYQIPCRIIDAPEPNWTFLKTFPPLYLCHEDQQLYLAENPRGVWINFVNRFRSIPNCRNGMGDYFSLTPYERRYTKKALNRTFTRIPLIEIEHANKEWEEKFRPPVYQVVVKNLNAPSPAIANS